MEVSNKGKMFSLRLWKLIFIVGYRFETWLFAVQVSLERDEIVIRLDLLFFGLFIGYHRYS